MIQFLSSMLKPAEYLQREMEEIQLVDFALAHMESQSLSCLLDSAGPIHERARHIILSGEPAGVFLQKSTTWTYVDLVGDRTTQVTEEAFSKWLTDFHRLNLGPCGPMLFPMLTYEAFPQAQSAQLGHPLWPDVDGIWLLTQNHFAYDRASRVLSLPDAFTSDQPCKRTPLPAPSTNSQFRNGWRETQAEYAQKIQQVKRDIFEGNYYQANLSQRYAGTTTQDPVTIYRRMRQRNPSPFMGIFRWDSLWVLSGSPERLIHKNGNQLSARPIAGTQPRLPDPHLDEASKNHLRSSPKELAEHLMLVDLERNDLGRVARPGSVVVREFATLESYSHVHHLVSQVEAILRDDISLVELIRAVFPGGTITGAPKIACMNALAQLEGEARGPYTGSLGFLDTQGTLDLNILIRTLIQRGQQICFHAGGGIVADSMEASEYLETRHKAAALMEALTLNA